MDSQSSQLFRRRQEAALDIGEIADATDGLLVAQLRRDDSELRDEPEKGLLLLREQDIALGAIGAR